jgi:hypothetical protein
MVKERLNIPKPIRDQVLKEYSHRCAIRNEDNPQIHHIDENPSNNDPLNLIPLCPNCHSTIHNSLTAIGIGRLQFFRRYKHPFILAPQFQPLFKRLQFLNEIRDDSDVDDLQSKAAELRSFVRTHERGDFYSNRIGGLLQYPEFNASFSIGMDGRVPQWYIDGKNNERPQYLTKLKNAREHVFELIVEMLAYQNWQQTGS